MPNPLYIVLIALVALLMIFQTTYDGPATMNVYEFIDWIKGNQ